MAKPDEPNQLRPPDGLWRRRVASFGHAGRGVWSALRSEIHLRFHALATVLVLGLGFYYRLGRLEWALVALAVAGVWTAELLNTAIEALTDLASPDFHPLAGKAKDVAAGAVLLAAAGAVAVGALVFGPHLFSV
ncbi:diacylglycerol kinase family protein [Hymenobacter sp. DH14]|uniref:Diacylglycerol kinase family protein n=1 Tax=Hymenobacter cyanobacteriorum TaxID=2926463 RepID=A0A9X2AG01_9BACT|nr:diacylglycerol kinase family protein [Hymenobacter cyanobacteriorum]